MIGKAKRLGRLTASKLHWRAWEARVEWMGDRGWVLHVGDALHNIDEVLVKAIRLNRMKTRERRFGGWVRERELMMMKMMNAKETGEPPSGCQDQQTPY